MEKVDDETLKYIMRSMTTNDRELQRKVMQEYTTDDVKFTHFLGDVRGKDAMYGVYRAAATGIDYKLIFVEMVITEQTAAIWVDLNIKLAPFYLKRYHAPTIVMLRFRRCSDGKIRICEQIDHHSIFVTMWALGWPISALFDNVIRRATGAILCTTGWAIDTAQDATQAAWDCSRSLVAGVLNQTLPQPILDALPGFITEPLELRVSQRKGPGVSGGYVDGVPAAAPAVLAREEYVAAAASVAKAVGSASAAVTGKSQYISGDISPGTGASQQQQQGVSATSGTESSMLQQRVKQSSVSNGAAAGGG